MSIRLAADNAVNTYFHSEIFANREMAQTSGASGLRDLELHLQIKSQRAGSSLTTQAANSYAKKYITCEREARARSTKQAIAIVC
jgi:hypothetical protein